MSEVLALGGGSDSFYEEVIKDALDNRILIMNQDVDDSLVEDIIMRIIRWNMEDVGLPANKRKRILLVINSCGGDMFVAENVINIIENSTTPIVGVAMGLVASAAYYIYLSCHTRIAFKDSVLLQHDGNVAVNNSGRKAKNTMDFFSSMDERVKKLVLAHTTMTEEFYDEMEVDEFYFYADKAKELGAVDKIIGEDITFDKVFCGE